MAQEPQLPPELSERAMAQLWALRQQRQRLQRARPALLVDGPAERWVEHGEPLELAQVPRPALWAPRPARAELPAS